MHELKASPVGSVVLLVIGASKNEKRVVRRKAGRLCIVNGEIMYKKKVGQVNICKHSKNEEYELKRHKVRYVTDKKERLRIVQPCHSDPTSGHLGIKKTLTRINERFIWPGITRNVHEVVSH